MFPIKIVELINKYPGLSLERFSATTLKPHTAIIKGKAKDIYRFYLDDVSEYERHSVWKGRPFEDMTREEIVWTSYNNVKPDTSVDSWWRNHRGD